MRAAVQERGTAHVMFATGNSQLAFVAGAGGGDRRGALGRTRWSSTWTSTSGWGPTTRRASSAGSASASWSRRTPRAAYYVEGLGDAEAECLRYAELLRSHPLDLCCLGIGENGHLAFNDPPVADFADPLDVKVVELDAACRMQQVQRGPLRRAWTPSRPTPSP